jgi:hypothetical protein
LKRDRQRDNAAIFTDKSQILDEEIPFIAASGTGGKHEAVVYLKFGGNFGSERSGKRKLDVVSGRLGRTGCGKQSN